jgi:hypothetical protein
LAAARLAVAVEEENDVKATRNGTTPVRIALRRLVPHHPLPPRGEGIAPIMEAIRRLEIFWQRHTQYHLSLHKILL